MSSVFNIRWPDTGLESRLKALAVANRRSLQAEVLVALERYVGLVLPAVAPGVVREGESFARAEVSAEVAAPSIREARDALERVGLGGLPSASQVAKRPFKPDFK